MGTVKVQWYIVVLVMATFVAVKISFVSKVNFCFCANKTCIGPESKQVIWQYTKEIYVRQNLSSYLHLLCDVSDCSVPRIVPRGHLEQLNWDVCSLDNTDSSNWELILFASYFGLLAKNTSSSSCRIVTADVFRHSILNYSDSHNCVAKQIAVFQFHVWMI